MDLLEFEGVEYEEENAIRKKQPLGPSSSCIDNNINNISDNNDNNNFYILEIEKLNKTITLLKKQAQEDAEALVKAQVNNLENSNSKQHALNLEILISNLRNESIEVEQRAMTELIQSKKIFKKLETRIIELESEIEISKEEKQRFFLNTEDYDYMIQCNIELKDKIKLLSDELSEVKLKNIKLQTREDNLITELNLACSSKKNIENRLNEVENDLKGLNEAEAGMQSAMQAKSIVENRVKLLQDQLLNYKKGKENAEIRLEKIIEKCKLSIDDMKNEVLESKNQQDMMIRSKKLAEVELSTEIIKHGNTKKELEIINKKLELMKEENGNILRENESLIKSLNFSREEYTYISEICDEKDEKISKLEEECTIVLKQLMMTREAMNDMSDGSVEELIQSRQTVLLLENKIKAINIQTQYDIKSKNDTIEKLIKELEANKNNTLISSKFEVNNDNNNNNNISLKKIESLVFENNNIKKDNFLILNDIDDNEEGVTF